MKRLVLYLYLIIHMSDTFSKGPDLIAYSYNRPIQIYALLESLELYADNLASIQVIYRASNKEYRDGYEKVWLDFPMVKTYCQGNEPSKDFKPLTMHALEQCTSGYVVFAVDDNLMKDYVDLEKCVELMDLHGAYGFYLRLGKNIRHSYVWNVDEKLPNFIFDDGIVCTWTFAHVTHTWGYPNTVDMTIYRKQDVIDDFSAMGFENPNLIETWWSRLDSKVKHRTGICFSESKVINVPLNRVQNVHWTRHMNFMGTGELLTIFNGNKKIDILPLYRVHNCSAHMEYVPTFIEREIEG